MSSFLATVERNKKTGKKMFAVLLDPEKCIGAVFSKTKEQLQASPPDFIFIGGSTGHFSSGELINQLSDIEVPKILFPGDAAQFTSQADALLFLSLLSGRNSDYLIGQHVRSAREIKQSGIEVVPTAYILVDGGKNSAVEKVSKTRAIPVDELDKIIATAVAGELLGMQITYLEAGSGAATPINQETIAAVRKELGTPLIVGGGIRNTKQIESALKAGADLIVIGNALEVAPDKITEFSRFFSDYNNKKEPLRG